MANKLKKISNVLGAAGGIASIIPGGQVVGGVLGLGAMATGIAADAQGQDPPPTAQQPPMVGKDLRPIQPPVQQAPQQPGILGRQPIVPNTNAEITPNDMLSRAILPTDGPNEPPPPITEYGNVNPIDNQLSNMPGEDTSSLPGSTIAKGITSGDNPSGGTPTTPGGTGPNYGNWANALAWGQQALNLGSGIWNMTRKPNELPQPDQVAFDRVDYKTDALAANQAVQRNRSTANAVYASRGNGLQSNELSGVYANQMGQMAQDAATTEGIKNDQNRTNAAIQQQENAMNTETSNKFGLANAEYLNNFDSHRGMYLTQGLSNISTIERDRMNSRISIDSANKAGSITALNDEYDRYSLDPDNPSNPLRRPDGTYMNRNDFMNSRMGVRPLHRQYS